MTDINNLLAILSAQRATILTFYTLGGHLRYLKCIDHQGTLFFLRVPSSYQLTVPHTFHIVPLTPIERVPIVEDSSEYKAVSSSTASLDDLYADIYLQKSSDQYKVIFEQMARIGKCFKKLHYRLVIESDGVICTMTPDLALEWYKINFTGKCHWYTIAPLDVFYENKQKFATETAAAERELAHILDSIQSEQLRALKRRTLSAVHNKFARVSQRKTALTGEIAALVKAFQKVSAYEKELQEKREEARGTEKPARATHHLKESERLTTLRVLDDKLLETRTMILKVASNLLTTNEQLKNIYLEADRILYPLMKILDAVEKGDFI